ncbi:MFS transporter [Magnetospirillum sp. 15-1]|uniref:MFS transporter n=1 Tax=Magnetospirillum sp. 15-1 TaxID=1979370 RepID=UPI000BBB7163|nr:MFS transporter [Magnetospirillum sp. 15-1]
MIPALDRRRVAVAAAGFCSFLDMYSTHALLPTLRAEFGVGEAMAAATVSATTLAVACMAPLAGHLADRLGRKRVMVAGALLMVIPTALAATSADMGQLILWRFLQGLFLPAVFSVATAHIGEEWPQSEAVSMIGLHMAGMVAGGFCGRYITALVAAAAGWRAAFPVLALLNLAGALVIALWMPADRSPKPAPAVGQGGGLAVLRRHLGNLPLMATCGIGFGLLFCMTGTFTYMNFHLAAPPYLFGPVALGTLFAITLFGVPASAAGVFLLRRFSRRVVVAGAVALTSAGLLITLADEVAVILVGLSLFSFGQLISQPVALGSIAHLARDGRAMAVGLYVSSYYLGGSVGGVLPAWTWSHYGWPGCVALVVAVEISVAALAAAAWRMRG